jgi:hypothetical protein
MAAATIQPVRLSTLTDVQLIHHVNNAVRARDCEDRSSQACRLLRTPGLPRLSYPMVLLTLQLNDALQGAWLALRLAAPDRLTAWAERSDRRMRAVIDDIAILGLLAELERRVTARKAKTIVAAPALHNGGHLRSGR